MASNARGHQIPAPTDLSITRQTIFENFANSIRDVVGVANTTARGQLVTDLTAAGEGPSASKPLVIHRADAPGLHRVEATPDGSVFVPVSGVLRFASVSARDSWTTSNSGLLSVGDVCIADGERYEWLGAGTTTSGWNDWANLTMSTGWTATSGQTPRVRMICGVVYLDGAATRGAGGALSSIAVAPVWARPSKTRFIGASVSTKSATTPTYSELYMSLSGVISVIDYSTIDGTAGWTIPLAGSFARL